MDVRLIDSEDEDALAEFAAVLVASDKEMWPDLTGFTLSDLRAFARFRGASRRWELLAAGEPGATAVLEVDEAWLAKVAASVGPAVVVLIVDA